jgi:hypothetical protein
MYVQAGTHWWPESVQTPISPVAQSGSPQLVDRTINTKGRQRNTILDIGTLWRGSSRHYVVRDHHDRFCDRQPASTLLFACGDSSDAGDNAGDTHHTFTCTSSVKYAVHVIAVDAFGGQVPITDAPTLLTVHLL